MKSSISPNSPVIELALPLSKRDHIQGAHNARMTLLEYGDFECPVCGRAYPIIKAVQHELGDRLCFAFRHFPLTKVHPHAEAAAESAEGAGAQGRFWEMHDVLFENQDALDDGDIAAYAAALKLNAPKIMEELAAGSHRARVRQDFTSGVRSNVNGTPCFFINGVRYDGLQDADTLLSALTEEIH